MYKSVGFKLGYSGLIERIMQIFIRNLRFDYFENILFISYYFSDFVFRSLSKLQSLIFLFQKNGYDSSKIMLLRSISMKFYRNSIDVAVTLNQEKRELPQVINYITNIVCRQLKMYSEKRH